MDVIRLVVQLEGSRAGRSQVDLRLGDRNREIQRRIIPRGVRDGGEVLGPG